MPIETGPPPESVAQIIRVELSRDEFNVINWSRFKAGPGLASWGDFARVAMLEKARGVIRAKGHKLPQGVAEALERLNAGVQE